MIETSKDQKKDEECCGSCCDLLDDANLFWNRYKHHSGKVAIGLSILGAVSAILVGTSAIAGSVALAITNSAIFFSGICYEKLKSINAALENDNHSLRKQTQLLNFKFGTSNQDSTESHRMQDVETPKSTTSTQYEPVKPFKANEPTTN